MGQRLFYFLVNILQIHQHTKIFMEELKMYKKVPTDLNFVQREKEVLDFWKENEVFEKSMEQTKQGPT